MRSVIGSIESEYRRYKLLAESAFRQLSEAQLAEAAFGNSVAALVWHLSGNLKSRFTDFLNTDGEKPWRNREEEFSSRRPAHAELLVQWEGGWKCLFDALRGLSDEDLSRIVTIRGLPLGVHEALHRSLAHAGYHVGQIVLLAKAMRGDAWQYLSIPPGKSAEYNRNPTLEKAPKLP